MTSFEATLNRELERIERQGLRRVLRRVDGPVGPHVVLDGVPLLNASSNDYLGFASHPALADAAARAARRYGSGSGASRLICGSLRVHHELEQQLAAFKGTAAALTFSSGFAAALGTLTALVHRGDVVLLDRLAHACLVDGARLSGATLRVFKHNDLNDLERVLQWCRSRASQRTARILIVTESLFSMDGDGPALRELVAIKERFGAWLMLDEAHATGLFGTQGRGCADAAGVSDRIEVQMGTLGKALGAAGGFIAGPQSLIDLLVNRARTFLFSTAPPPSMAAAAAAGLALAASAEGDERRARLAARLRTLHASGVIARFVVPPGVGPGATPEGTKDLVQHSVGPILPLPFGDEAAALSAADQLRQRGIYIPAIRYPTVPKGAARLRATLTSAHTDTDAQRLIAGLAAVAPPPSH